MVAPLVVAGGIAAGASLLGGRSANRASAKEAKKKSRIPRKNEQYRASPRNDRSASSRSKSYPYR